MPRISVVVPVYNVEPYLEECLVSIAAQTFTDLEVVMVEDGSTQVGQMTWGDAWKNGLGVTTDAEPWFPLINLRDEQLRAGRQVWITRLTPRARYLLEALGVASNFLQ